MPVVAKTARQFWGYLSNKSNIHKIFEGEFHLNFFYNFPSSILGIYASFQSYFQKLDTGQIDLQPPGMYGIACFLSVMHILLSQ